MSWTELRINTTAEAIDWVSTLLASIDYRGDIHTAKYDAQYDASDNPEYDPNSDLNYDASVQHRQLQEVESQEVEAKERTAVQPWAFTVCLYFPEQGGNQAQTNRQINQIEELLFPLYRTGMTTRAEFAHVEEKPASREAALNQIHRVGQRFVIVPLQSTSPGSSTDRSSTENIAADYQARTPDELILKLGASLTFGSGLHPTTMLCLQILERYVQPGMKALDLGSGSGILSIALAKLGAQVLSIDNDPIAVEATKAAVQQNQVTEQVTVQVGSLGSGSELGHWMGGDALVDVPTIVPNHDFDLIVSNVFARIQTSLAESFAQALRRTTPQNGILITSGYTLDYQEQIDEALTTAGFEAIDRLQFEEWLALVHRLESAG